MPVERGYLQDRFVQSVIVGAILLALIWVGNIYTFQQYQLTEPLFLPHNYELNYNDTDILDLYYLVSANDKAEVIFLSFPALDSTLSIYPSVRYQQRGDYYLIKQVQVQLNEELISSLDASEVLLEEANVTFDNGIEGTFNIGQIRLHAEPVPSHFAWQSWGGGGNNTGNHNFVANETVEVVGLDSAGDYDLPDIRLNGESISQDLFPFTVTTGRRLNVEYALESPHDFQDFNFARGLTLLTRTEDGEKGQTHFRIDYFQLQVNEMKKLLRNRGEL
ncbi:hypothetical protein [Dethiobacter alkaliphilus]|uniref:Uncharacterized protein n=1 Tax=Dethiobacter alkaliphilus AHT 1 TaxID=555088 RepID=C0GD13_DETAL|nr:hypothetical protein [Dethiobacter alkaliphilus]EEG79098.1 hypothetical protein DealDRAFT_0372 [Dethiobacter alkaliphilus AHT 1]